MRKYYPTKTLRNFSLYSVISINKTNLLSLDDIMKRVKQESKEKINKEEMDSLMTKTVLLVKRIRFIPLFIKKPIAKLIYEVFGDKSNTTVLSNLGKINIPKEMEESILKADFILGTSSSNKALFSIITIGNILTFTISEFMNNLQVQNDLYHLFKKYQLIINIHGSDKYEIKK